MSARPVLITGGAGFIGANSVLDWTSLDLAPVINLDKLTYAGNLDNLARLSSERRHEFVQGDIADRALVAKLLKEFRPRAVVNFAAESHVDRSIHGPEEFIDTNVVGTFRLLETVRGYVESLGPTDKASFRFLHVSTDEVFGALKSDDAAFTELTRRAIHSRRSRQPDPGGQHFSWQRFSAHAQGGWHAA